MTVNFLACSLVSRTTKAISFPKNISEIERETKLKGIGGY